MATYNFNDHKKGDTFPGVTFTVTVNASPLNLTNATIKMAVKTSKTAGTTAVKLFTSTSNNFTILDATEGIFKFNSQIISIPAGTYFYDIQIVLADGTVKTYIEGTWKILQDITD